MQTIFIVDDNRTNLVAAKQALDGVYKTLQIVSANQMFALLERITPDLILLDIDMPEMNGFEAAARIRANERLKFIPIIFLTALHDEASELRGFELGALDFIIKPFSKSILLKRLETYLNIDVLIKQRTAELELSHANMDKLKNSIIAVIADMVEGRDDATGKHIERTQRYLDILVKVMQTNNVYADEVLSWDLNIVLPSAQLHDIGKIAIPDHILNKPAAFTDEEFAIMKTHAAEGMKLINKISDQMGAENAAFLHHAKLFAGTHHEKWNGTGYPLGLAGEDIPIEGRIMAIADVYDALTSKRVYKPAFSHEKAVDIIKSDSGTHFDPKLVDIFLKVESEFLIKGAVI